MSRRDRTIVVVDDNELIRISLRAILRQAGHVVVGEAKCGDSALEMIDRHVPDLVCLDVNMPGRNGLDVLGEVRQRWPKVRVMMVTSQADRDSIQTMLARGADDIILKPFNGARVVETIARAFKR